jgi:hypothetical protein
MTALPLDAAPAGLRIAQPDDRDRYKAAVEAGKQMGWGYYFPYLLAHDKPGRQAMLLDEDGGSVCVYRWQTDGARSRLDLYLPPIPLDVGALRRCLERANDFNGDRSARVVRIDAKDTAAMSELPLRIRERRQQYVFAPRTYADLSGTRCYTIRRKVALVERLPDVAVAPFAPAHADACRALLERWRSAHRQAHGTAGGAGVSRRMIDLAGTLPESDLRGEVVHVDGRLVSFAFGGEIRRGLASSVDRKCDNEVRGLSSFHFRSFLLGLRDFDLVNDGSDAGRPGLRQLKESFRPVEMHAEHQATQR